MTPQPEKESLLNEVLAEGESGEPRDALLSDLLRQVRWRRQRRTAARAGGALMVMALLILIVFVRPHRVAPSTLPIRPGASVELVATQPLSERAIVQTSPFSADCIVSSMAVADTVTTKRGVGYTLIDDAQLLALIAPRQAALVRVRPGEAQLIFVNPKDRYGFPLN